MEKRPFGEDTPGGAKPQRKPLQFGELLVRHGYLTSERLASLLAMQEGLHPGERKPLGLL